MSVYWDVKGKGECVLYFHIVIKYGHKGTVLLHIKRWITCSELTFRWIIIQQSIASSYQFYQTAKWWQEHRFQTVT